MKLKQSISIILSGVMAANLTCSYIAQASTSEAVDVNTTTITEAIPSESTDVTVDKNDVKTTEIKKTEKQLKYSENVESRYSRKELIDRFITKNGKYLPKSKIRDLNSKLQKLSDEDIYKLNSAVSLENPKHIRLISIFFGGLGIDRMIIGKVGTGILKLLLGVTVIPSFIWWLVDIFKIGKLTKEQNWKKLKAELKEF